MPLQRPRHLLSCAVLGTALLLSACGFQLRGTATEDIPLQELRLSVQDEYGQIHRALRESLISHGVRVTDSARYHLQLQEADSRRSLGNASRGGPIERELRSELTYVISNRDGRLLLGPETLTAQRSYGADRNNVTGNTEEEQLLRNEMHQELIRQLVLRLSHVSPAALEAREQALDGSGQPAPTR